MRSLPLRLLAGSVMVLSLACSTAEPTQSTDEMLVAAEALDEAFVTAFNQGDANAMAGLYWNSPDVVSYLPDVLEVRGHDAIREANALSFAAAPGAQLELTEKHLMAAGDVVIGWGLWRISIPTADGEPVELIGRYTDVKAERDGRWVYLLDHASMPLPPPASN